MQVPYFNSHLNFFTDVRGELSETLVLFEYTYLDHLP